MTVTKKEPVICVKDVSKDFVLSHEKASSIKGAFVGVFKKRTHTTEMQHALQDISFEVKPGEFFCIAGRNGSGKSTLLKILAGIYQPTRGTVSTKGKLVPFIELGVGFNPELTGRENVYLNGAMLGFSRPEIDAMYDGIVEFAELGNFMDKKLKNYSSGMQVRLAFSMATRSEADILLVDEVLAVGDADFQRKCFDYFRKLKKLKKTVVFVSHDMGAVREYCDRGVLIEDSRLVLSGTANMIADEYTRLFIPKNEADGQGSLSRVGNRKAYFTKVSVPKRLTAADATVRVDMEVSIEEDIDSLLVGFKVTDPLDKPLFGFNNKLGEQELHDMKAGQVVKLSFYFDNLFNEGVYSLDVTAESGTGEMYDWWVRSKELKVYKEKKTGYPIEPKIDMALEVSGGE